MYTIKQNQRNISADEALFVEPVFFNEWILYTITDMRRKKIKGY